MLKAKTETLSVVTSVGRVTEYEAGGSFVLTYRLILLHRQLRNSTDYVIRVYSSSNIVCLSIFKMVEADTQKLLSYIHTAVSLERSS